MTTTFGQHNHVLFRTVAITTTVTATPEIREIAMVDAIWEQHVYRFESVELRQFSTCADEDEFGLPACNPAYCTDVFWGSTPTVIVVHDGPSARLVVPPEFTGNLPWVDTYRVARVLWPGLWRGQYTLEALVNRLELREFIEAHVGGTAVRSATAWNAVATAAVLSTQVYLASQRDPSSAPAHKRLASLFQSLAAPAWISELVSISCTPAPPLRELPAPWDDDVEWASVGGEDLAWALADERALCSRDGLHREIERRRLQEEGRSFPFILCRHGSSQLP